MAETPRKILVKTKNLFGSMFYRTTVVKEVIITIGITYSEKKTQITINKNY